MPKTDTGFVIEDGKYITELSNLLLDKQESEEEVLARFRKELKPGQEKTSDKSS